MLLYAPTCEYLITYTVALNQHTGTTMGECEMNAQRAACPLFQCLFA